VPSPSAASSPRSVRTYRSFVFWRRVVQFLAALASMGMGLAIMLESGIGVGPWAVFHDGLARVTPLSFGQALILVGFVVGSLAWIWTGVRPGPGTIVNMVLVGPFVDLFRSLPAMPSGDGLVAGLLQFLVGLLVIGIASGAYIATRFGAGPRDMFMLGLAQRLRFTIRRTRTLIELVVLLIGIALGGSVGLGTVVFALMIGPAVQVSLRMFGYTPASAPSRESRRAPLE